MKSENRRELAEIKSVLLNLTQELSALGKSTASNAQKQTDSLKCNASKIDSQKLAGSLAGSLVGTIGDDLRQQITTEIAKIRQDLGSLQKNANQTSDREILTDIHRLSEDIQELRAREIVTPAQFGEMTGELRGIQGGIASLAEQTNSEINPQEISESIQQSYSEISQRLDSLGSSQTGSQIEQLSAKLETIRESIPATDPQTLIRIENQLEMLSSGISGLADKSQSSGSDGLESVLPSYFENLDRRMDEITRAVVASSVNDNFDQEQSAFDRIEARIASLSKTVENFSQDNAAAEQNPQFDQILKLPDQLQENMLRLEAHISQISSQSNQEDALINDEFKSQLAVLTEKIDNIQDNAGTTTNASTIDPRLNEKLDSLATTLERAINSGDGSVNQLETQIAELSNRFDQISHTSPGDVEGRAVNEGRIIEELQSLASRVEKIDAGQDQINQAQINLDETQIGALETQISSIAAQLNTIGEQSDLSAIESRLGGIEEQFATNQAIQPSASIGSEQDGQEIISTLAQDVKNLTQSSSELQGHSLETFDAVRNSLSMILDRINGIEEQISNNEPVFSSENTRENSDQDNHNTDMVDAAKEYASSLASQNDEPLLPKEIESLSSDSYNNDLDGSVHTNYEATLPQVDAPSLDIESQDYSDHHLEPQNEFSEADIPLEPGTGAPNLSANELDMNSLMEKAKQNRRNDQLEDEQQNPTDFIAAARRAAQSAANEAATQETEKPKKSKKRTGFSVKGLLPSAKKPLMMGASALVLAAVSFSAYKYFASNSDTQSVEVAAQAQMEQPSAAEPQPGTDTEVLTADAASSETNPEKLEITTPQTPEIDLPTQSSIATPLISADLLASASEDISAPAPDISIEPPTRQITLAPMPPKEVGPIALRQAAATGNAKALFEVGRRYTQGINGNPDFGEAIKWYERSAEQGFAPAQYRLGNFHEKGHGVTSDADEAHRWYTLAANQGNALSMHNLAVINAMGVLKNGVNMVEASTWFEKAAEHGVKDSQVNLGIVYAKAMGVEADLAKAYKWFAIAAKAGDKDAAQKRDTIAKQLRPEQLEQARGSVEIWQPKKLDAAANSIVSPPEWVNEPQTTASLTNKQMVKKSQAMLLQLGFKPGPADGVMGNNTTSAIKKFQKRAGIPVDGKVSQQLLIALEKATG